MICFTHILIYFVVCNEMTLRVFEKCIFIESNNSNVKTPKIHKTCILRIVLSIHKWSQKVTLEGYCCIIMNFIVWLV